VEEESKEITFQTYLWAATKAADTLTDLLYICLMHTEIKGLKGDSKRIARLINLSEGVKSGIIDAGYFKGEP
jgi:hypothetical protein